MYKKVDDDPETDQLAVFLMVNTLGGTSPIEDNIFTAELIEQLRKLNFKIARTYIGCFISSLNLRGYTVTMLMVSNVKYTLLIFSMNLPCKFWWSH